MTSDTLSRQGLAEFAARRRPDFERWLRELVNVPSVSVDPIRRDDLRRCAEIALDVLTEAGVPEVELIETGGHLIMHGRFTNVWHWPTVTLYNHLDVQPADDADWPGADRTAGCGSCPRVRRSGEYRLPLGVGGRNRQRPFLRRRHPEHGSAQNRPCGRFRHCAGSRAANQAARSDCAACKRSG